LAARTSACSGHVTMQLPQAVHAGEIATFTTASVANGKARTPSA
jgi:hypothetical protein